MLRFRFVLSTGATGQGIQLTPGVFTTFSQVANNLPVPGMSLGYWVVPP